MLFYAGHPELLRLACLGIVGARSGGEYSQQALAYMLPELPRNVAVVSGLAKGADGIAHQAALTTGLPPIGVIATGLDQFYPPRHRQLQQRVAQHGLLVSEYPPGTGSLPYRFVARNRIIAGLSHALLVTEARHKSGSLITATMALEAGRTVCVLPNRIDAPLGVGPNELIQQGATLVRQAADIVAELQYFA
ncbi:DNA-processing protein DprA [Lacticaseibacillus thailandensis]|uniref:DNA-processing protein DprA n=1 Tax=Lacticaseibacillus thailandensis TaxID=381741 RepID=UPI000A7BFA62|nr:DNA-processing protein DprA [Lacticaseibacillus thailandensis]